MGPFRVYGAYYTTFYCINYIYKLYLKDDNCMFRLSFLSHLQVVILRYFNLQLTLF